MGPMLLYTCCLTQSVLRAHVPRNAMNADWLLTVNMCVDLVSVENFRGT